MNHKLVFLAVLLGLVSLSYSAAGTTQVTGCSIVGITGNTTVCNFTSSGTFNLSLVNSNINAYVLVVGGGGGGGGVSAVAQYTGGGGGGGSIVYNTSYILTAGSSYTATVGAAGAAGGNTGTRGGNGTNSTFGVLTAGGGRSGGGSLAADAPGTNGTNFTGGAGGGAGSRATTEQGGTSGFEGYGGNSTSGGGGGGGAGGNATTMGGGNAIASATAPVAGLGGNGSSYTISGASVAYGGGGGGGTNATGTVGAGGTGGGGSGGKNAVGVAGTANRGGGGGGAGGSSARVGGAGGTGVIILNYTAYEINVSFAANSQASAVIGRNYLEINVTSTVAYASVLDHINITLYNAAGGIVASSESNTTPFFYNITGIADGNYSLNATAQDTAGFVDKTETRWFGVDTTNPAINIHAPTTNTTITNTTNNWIAFNVTSTDLNLKNLTMNLFNSTGGTLNTTTTSQTWWNTTWRYKTQINITNLTCVSSYCQFNMSLDLNETYTNGSDIRILNSSENGELTFWREDGWAATTASGNIWINASNGTYMIWIYYNASGVSDKSSVDDTFILGDDFDSGTLNTTKWTITGSGYNTSCTSAGVGTCGITSSAASFRYVTAAISFNSNNTCILANEFHPSTSLAGHILGFVNGSAVYGTASPDVFYFGYSWDKTTGYTRPYNVSDTSIAVNKANQWQLVKLCDWINGSTRMATVWVNETQYINVPAISNKYTKYLGISQLYDNGKTFAWDYAFVYTYPLATPSFITGTETPITTSFNIINNYTSLSVGTYYFNATAYDFFGYYNSTETRNVTIVSAVASFPAINIHAPTTNTTITNTTNNWIAFNVTSTDLNLKNLTMNLFNSTGGTLNTTTTSQTWWNTTWRYKTQINITNLTCVSSYCQFNMSLDLNETYTNGSDIRILNSSENGELTFWREDGWAATTASGNIWINASNGTYMIWIYYNASGVSDKSSVDDTFILGDDFDSGTLNTTKWTITGSGYNTSCTSAGVGTCGITSSAASFRYVTAAISFNSNNTCILANEFHPSTSLAGHILGFVNGSAVYGTASPDVFYFGYSWDKTTGYTRPYNVSDTSIAVNKANQWQLVKLCDWINGSTRMATVWVNETQYINVPAISNKYTKYLGISQLYDNGKTFAWDYAFVYTYPLATPSFITGTETPITTSFNIINNYTSLSVGTYYFNATAYDFFGYYNSTETRNVTIVSAVASFFSMVGGAINWTWQTVDAGEIVMSGSPINWTWQVFAAGSGRQIPNGTATNWTWVNE